MYWETPKICIAAPTPANSLTVRPALAMSSRDMAPNVLRAENCSRMRPPRPSPVYDAEPRAHLLDHDEGDGDQDHQEQGPVAELRARRWRR